MSPVVLFAALADATRCRVVEMLRERPRPVHDLAAAFSISRPAISRHLRVLKEAGLVLEQRQGRENVYSLQPHRLQPLSEWLNPSAPAPAAVRKPPVPALRATPQLELEL
jgi:DNA-binding transcriptional ArsR family regulator